MLFRTADGYKLLVSPEQLPRLGHSLARIAPHLFPPGAQSASPDALLPILGSLAARSSFRRVYTSADSRRRYPLFTPGNALPGFDLLAVPRQDSDVLLLQTLRPHPDVLDTEVERKGGSVTITWRPVKLLSLLNPKIGADNGVYILERDGKPLYVGITLESFRNRWNKRFQVLEQLHLPLEPHLGRDTLWLGTLSGFDKKEFVPRLRMVEHVLVRYISQRAPNVNRGRLANQMLKRPLIPLGDIVITNGGAVPPFLPSAITVAKGGRYELAPEMGPWQSQEKGLWTHWPH